MSVRGEHLLSALEGLEDRLPRVSPPVCFPYLTDHEAEALGTAFDTHAPPGTEDAGCLCPVCGTAPSNRWRLRRMRDAEEDALVNLRRGFPERFRHVPTDELRTILAACSGIAHLHGDPLWAPVRQALADGKRMLVAGPRHNGQPIIPKDLQHERLRFVDLGKPVVDVRQLQTGVPLRTVFRTHTLPDPFDLIVLWTVPDLNPAVYWPWLSTSVLPRLKPGGQVLQVGDPVLPDRPRQERFRPSTLLLRASWGLLGATAAAQLALHLVARGWLA